MEPSENDITATRNMALEKLEKSPGLKQIHPKDVERVKSDNSWIRRFLLHHDLDKEKAVNMIVGTLQWRFKTKVNEISQSNINMDIANSGGMFPYSRDKDGKQLFIIKVKSNVKGAFKSEDIQKVVVYWFERLEKQEKGDKISIFFEMTGAGLSNLDMEFVQYLIALFRDYYPFFLNYIIVFEMSWILNAAWKLVKSWMPPKSVDMVKFLGRSDLKDFVPVSQQLAEWGGSITYSFAFEPEFLPLDGQQFSSHSNDDARKKVHFAEDTNMQENNKTHDSLDRKIASGQFLTLTPPEEIVFRREDSETVGTLSVTNTSPTLVAYKIKTTSPDKYRVRPSAGTINPGTTLNISVHIQAGYSASQLVRDKFLVMACAVDNDSTTSVQVGEIWKRVSENNIQQHRLRCSVAASDARDEEFSSDNKASSKFLTDLNAEIKQLCQNQEDLKKQLNQVRLLLVLFLMYFLISRIWSMFGDVETGAYSQSCQTLSSHM